MRIVLLVHAFPPRAVTGVEVHAEALAGALAAAGDEVCVLAPERDPAAPHLAQREERRGPFSVTWLNLVEGVDDEATRRAAPGAAGEVGRFLDRERPDAVVVLHLLRLGEGVLDEARRRDLPLVFIAQDAFAVSDELNLVGPDLAALEPGDLLQAARCRLARGVLDRHLEAHDGFIEPGDSGPAAVEVRRVLAGEGEDTAEVRRLAARIGVSLAARREALERCDRVEAPTAYLAGVLRDGGLARPVEVRALGIEREELSAPARRERAPGAPLRVLQLGGLYEHKGAHLLLEAARGLGGRVEVSLRGTAGSSGHAARLAELAGEVGASLGGPYTRGELPGLLAACDVVAVPSLWPENAPFVIREAFAAGRPVLASDTPALRESVRDGVDGCLLPQGDAEAWRRALARLADDPSELERLVDGVRPPLSIQEDAAALRAVLRELIDRRELDRERRLERLPASVRGLARQHAELARLPHRELVRRAAAGLAERAREAGVEVAGLEALPLLVAAGGERLRERLADLSRAGAWRAQVGAAREVDLQFVRASLEEARRAAASEAERATWQGELTAEREQRIKWLESVVTDRDAELQALREELELSRSTEVELERRAAGAAEAEEAAAAERTWLSERLADREAHLGELDRQLADRKAHVTELEGQLDEATRRHAAERRSLDARLADLQAEYEALLADDRALQRAAEELRAAFEGQSGRLREHEEERRALEAQLAASRDGARALTAALEAAHGEREAVERRLGALEADREAARRHEQHLEGRITDLEEELGWRRDEMRALREEVGAPLLGRGARKARRRLASWEAVEERDPQEDDS